MRRRINPDDDQLPYEEWIPTEAVMFHEDGTVSLEMAEPDVSVSNRGRRRRNAESVVQTIFEQLKRLGISLRYRFVQWGPNALKVSKGESGVIIHYDRGRDLYDVEEYHGFGSQPLREGVYAEDLLDVIEPALHRTHF